MLALSVAALGAMLVLFLNVVQQQTSDGEQRRAAMSALADAAARCNAVTRTTEREACRAALAPVPRNNASLGRGAPAQR